MDLDMVGEVLSFMWTKICIDVA